MNLKVRRTPHTCWKCHNHLNHVEPAVFGWHYHCPTCQHLTSPRHELDEAMKNKPEGAAGIVAAVPCKIEILAKE